MTDKQYFGKGSFEIIGDKVIRGIPIFNAYGDNIGYQEEVIMDKQTFIECLKKWKEESE